MAVSEADLKEAKGTLEERRSRAFTAGSYEYGFRLAMVDVLFEIAIQLRELNRSVIESTRKV